jgi:hypothetical protein
MTTTLNLFGEEEPEKVKPSIKIGPRKLVKNPVVENETIKPVNSFKYEGEWEKEILDLMSATKNRLYIKGSEIYEMYDLEKRLRTGSQKSGRDIKNIVNQAKELLQYMRNFHTVQAVDKVCDGESVKLLNAWKGDKDMK